MDNNKKKKCPECGKWELEEFTELEYENADDPTPEYGGKLIEVVITCCGECG